MRETMLRYARIGVARYLASEAGDVLTWLLVFAALWLILSGSRVVVQ